MMNTDHWGWMGFGGLPMLLFWVLLIVAVVALVKWLVGNKAAPPAAPTPLERLKQRYANGEIDRDTYRQMKADIEDKSS